MRQMFAELDYPVARGVRAEILLALVEALEPLYSLLGEASGSNRGEGERSFAIVHLVARSLSDLIASGHLASHGYLQQAYNAMRPVLENCDLIELFAIEPEEAKRWVNDPEPGKSFRPAKVRARLGNDDSPEYGHFSEMGSHPRFSGSRLTGLMLVNDDDPTARMLTFRVGPFFPDHPSSVLIYLWLFQMIVRLGFKVRHLTEVSANARREQWKARYIESVKAASHGCKLIRKALREVEYEPDGEVVPLEAMYDPLIARLEKDR